MRGTAYPGQPLPANALAHAGCGQSRHKYKEAPAIFPSLPRFLFRLLPGLLLPALLCSGAGAQQGTRLDAEALQWLGARIFRNECASKAECLLSWNPGEDFPSLGIGHFIWYREGQREPFQETFPALLRYLDESGETLPAWIGEADFEQPWPDRDSFLAARDGEKLGALQALLERTMAQQSAFIVWRFETGTEALLAGLPDNERSVLRERIDAIIAADARLGTYALIDYVHFKGEGGNPSERYQGRGWGLLQVLQGIPRDSATPLRDFVASAREVLARRVALAPPERNEQRWLAGWNKRLDSYLSAQ